MTGDAFPNCRQRGVVMETEGGPRVHLSMLHGTFTLAERARWFKQSIQIPVDEFGLLPDAVEVFLRPVQQSLF